MMSYGGGSSSTDALTQHKKHGQKKNSRKANPHTMKRILLAFVPYRVEVITIALAILLGSLLGLVPAILISYIFDDAISKGNVTLLLIYVAIMFATLVLAGIISIGQAYLNNKVGQDVMYDFRNQLYQHLQSMPLSFFAGTRTGEIQSRLSNDVSGVQGAVTNTATSLVADITIIVSTIIAMLVLSPVLTLITLALFPLSGWVTYKVGATLRRMGKETQESLASLTAQMEETLSVSGILLVKVFGQQRYTQSQFQQENKTLAKLTLRQLVLGRSLSVIVGAIFSLMPALIYLIAGAQIIGHFSVLGGGMTIGTLIAFTTLQYRVFFPLGEITSLQAQFQGSLALFDRIFEYLDLPIAIQDKPDALQPEMVHGEVTFSNVTFTYKRDEYSVLTEPVGTVPSGEMSDNEPASSNGDPASDLQEEPRPALSNISFTIKPGQLAALVGPSGAGKTTITYLLPRLYDVDSGAVEIDGINVKDIALASLGELIGVVTQETYLFHASIRENLLYARRDATEEEMIAAAQAAAIHERIMELENGYDTIVGERGYKLSGGEKQRIAIARVILKNPRILMLDEATSALDTRSERLIQTALERVMKGRTTLAIAHRLSTILAADVILVVNKGEIVERGTHQELLVLGGLYAQLYYEQFSQPSGETEQEYAPLYQEQFSQPSVALHVSQEHGNTGQMLSLRLSQEQEGGDKPLSLHVSQEQTDGSESLSLHVSLTSVPRELTDGDERLSLRISLAHAEQTDHDKPVKGLQTETSPVPTGHQWEVSTTGAQLEVSAAGSQLEVSTTGAQLEVSAAERQLEVVATGSQLEVSTTEPQLEISAVERQLEVATTGPQWEVAATERQLEVSTQRGKMFPTGTLSIRVASKADLLSTTYLPPSVREIFTITIGREQVQSRPRAGSASFIKPRIRLIPIQPGHRVGAEHKGLLEKYAPPTRNVRVYGSVIDRNALTTPSHAPDRTEEDDDASLIEREGITLINPGELAQDPGHASEQVDWGDRQESFFPATSHQRVVMDVRSITKSLPLGREHVEILKGISFQIHSGEFVAIVGPSGSGKSTLLGIIAGLDQPTSGQVLVDGVDIASLPEDALAKVRNLKIGMVFQAFNLLPTLTALENVESPLLVGKRKGSYATRAKELLTLVGLEHRLHHHPRQMSGGEQQRVAIARALATDPPIVIADEPTGNLDARNGNNVLQLLDDLRTKTGKTFIIATHDPTVAGHADRAIRIVDGIVAGQAQGTAPTTTGGRITQ